MAVLRSPEAVVGCRTCNHGFLTSDGTDVRRSENRQYTSPFKRDTPGSRATSFQINSSEVFERRNCLSVPRSLPTGARSPLSSTPPPPHTPPMLSLVCKAQNYDWGKAADDSEVWHPYFLWLLLLPSHFHLSFHLSVTLPSYLPATKFV